MQVEPGIPLKIENNSRYHTINKNVVFSNENLLGIGPSSSSIKKTFYTTEILSEQGAFFNDSILELGYALSPDVMHYDRSVYTGLDLLGDVGGLYDALCAIAKILLFIVSLFTKGGPHDYIIQRLFKRGK